MRHSPVLPSGGTGGNEGGTGAVSMARMNDRRRTERRSRRSARVPVAVLACLFLIGACAGAAPAPPVAPPPTTGVDTSQAAALATYGEFWRVSRLAFAAPRSQDWAPALSSVAGGQALHDLLLEIANYASVPAHVDGTISQSPSLDPALAPTAERVAVLDCVDISKSTLVSDKNGAVLDDQAHQSNRYRYRAEVIRDPSGRWLVEKTAPSLAETC